MRRWGKKKTETSKKLLIFACILTIIISTVVCVAVFVIQDVTPLEFLIAGVYGLASTAFGFYFWKAKNENLQKFKEIEDDNSTEFDDNNI